jgi:hypothetical protein
MKVYEASTTIQAAPDAIWAILADASGYADWNSGIHRLEGRLGAGERVKLYSDDNPGRGWPLAVTEFDPGRRMTWRGGLPLGLLKGVRTFTLVPEDGGATRFVIREEFTGPLAAIATRTMPDLQPQFERFAGGLKARAEEGSDPS